MGEEITRPSTLIDKNKQAALQQVGFAIIGIGELTESQLLPAFEHCPSAKVTALVSDDLDKVKPLAKKYGIEEDGLYTYDDFDRIAENKNVDVVYIVLPNSLHKEYTIRAAKAGKHVLCEKPMAASEEEARAMIDVCKAHNKKLMVAYRIQYEPHHKVIRQWVKDDVFGKVKIIEAFNSENIDDPTQWRFKKELAGGGVLMDLGIYCVNTIRFLKGAEPIWVSANTYSTPGDERFEEVEETMLFQMGFADGTVATCGSSYGVPNTQRYRCYTAGNAWFGMDPAFPYDGLKIEISEVDGKPFPVPDVIAENQFSLLINHMAECVLEDKEPDTPGEEGLKDHIVIKALYESAKSLKRIQV